MTTRAMRLTSTVSGLALAAILSVTAYAALTPPPSSGTATPDEGQSFSAPEEMMATIDPRVRVIGYEIIEGTPSEKGDFTLRCEVGPANPYAGAYNVQITYYFPGEEGFIIQPEETNQFYLEAIPAGETAFFDMPLIGYRQYGADAILIEFQYTYHNIYGMGFANTNNISPLLSRECALEISSISVVEEAARGGKALVSVQYKNVGKLPAAKVEMHLAGKIAASEQIIALEAPKDDKLLMADTYVTFSEAGKQPLEISFIYEDENGKQHSIEPRSFNVSVREQSGVAILGGNGEALYDANKIWVYIGSGCTALLLFILLVLIIMKKKKEGR